MAGGDFDNDGDLDLVVVRSVGDTTDLFANDGAGTFTQAASLPGGADALAVAVGDLDDDGNLDVAVSRPGAPEVLVGFGDGQLGFSSQQAVALPGGGKAFNLAIGDANRDGTTDLLVADPLLSRVVLFPGSTPSDFGTEACELPVADTPGAVAFGDLSADGLADLVVSAYTGNRYVVITEIFPPIQTGKGGGGVPQCQYASFEVPLPARPSLATVGDVTGDGVPDLVACLAFTGTMCVGPGLAGGGVGELVLLDSTGLPLRPVVRDYDGNGQNDLFVLSGGGDRVNLWLARDSGRLAGARSYASTLPGASWVEGGDFDGDGDHEIVTGSEAGSTLAVLGGLAGGLAVELTIDVGLPVHQLEVGDLDLDGRPDIVVGVPGGLRILRNASTPGAYQFELLPATPATIGSGAYPFGITLGDFDRDGDIDIAVCDYEGGGLHIVPGTADAFVFEQEIVLAVDGGPVDVAAADFTGDGLVDLAVSRMNQSDITILRNEGSNVYVAVLTVPVGQSPNYLITSDFNRDGRADLVVSNADSGSVSVLFGSANGFSGQDYAAGLAPTALLARDLTGAGLEDILVASLQSGDFRVLVGDGRGSFPLLPTFPGTLGASDAVLQDMTGDALPDLVISSLITDRVSLVINIRQP